MFGMLTGTASTGMILLREIDPNYETPAANNLVLQQVPAIAFGAPLLLLMSFAAESITNSLIVFGIMLAMFIVYNIIVFRKYIFKKKKLPYQLIGNFLYSLDNTSSFKISNILSKLLSSDLWIENVKLYLGHINVICPYAPSARYPSPSGVIQNWLE